MVGPALTRLIALILVLVFVGTACGEEDDTTGGGEEPDPVDDDVVGGGPYPVADLRVHYTNPDAELDLTYRVSCQGDTAALTGDPVAVSESRACSALAREAAVERLTRGAPDDRVCTDVFGGADRAEITGTIDDQSVDTVVDRRNGCAINDWDELLGGLLPAPAGATPSPSPDGEPSDG